MSNRAKGARIQLRKARGARKAHWVIFDTVDGRQYEESTGCGAHDRGGAERKLEAYLAGKHVTLAVADVKHPSQIPIADVVALYARDVAPGNARPKEVATRLADLLVGFEGKTLADMNGELCRTFAKTCRTEGAARKRLEDLRAAINHHRNEGHCSHVVEVALPGKAQRRERWLTRSEAAKLILKAWRYREIQKGVATDRRSRRHVARFILVGLYTGSRASRVCGAAFDLISGAGYIDTERGVFYRRAPGERLTKKQAPPIPLPVRLLAHLRRWKRLGQKYAVEWDRAPVKRVSKAFAAAVKEARLGAGVVPHTLRHTAATWLMQEGTDPWEAAGYLGMTVQTLIDNYGHHHPDHLKGALKAFDKRRRA